MLATDAYGFLVKDLIFALVRSHFLAAYRYVTAVAPVCD